MPEKILIADDSLFMRKVLSDMLSPKYDIVEADSAQKAEQLFKKEKPDMTLLDIIMPEGEEAGISVLKKIKKADSKAKVIMITAIGQDTIMEECKKLGATDYITKPFDNQKILKTVAKYLD